MSLLVENISKYYNTQKALDQVSFKVDTGDIVGFLGPNGAGKSTMMKIITGYLKQNEGTILVNGLDNQKNLKEIRKQIGYLPEHNPLYTNMYIKEYLRYIAKLYKIPQKLDAKVAEIIETTGLENEQHKKIKQLSKGYRQRVGLAAALIHNPNILILDEPTTGLDPNQIIEIRQLIQNLGKNKTVFLSTHIMQEAEALCNRIIIINKGKIITDKNKQELKTSSNFNNTFILELDKKINPQTLLQIEGVKEISEPQPNIFRIKADPNEDITKKIFNFAVENKYIIKTIYKETNNIENIFRTLTQQK